MKMKSDAFTLMELILVAVIIVIIAATVAPLGAKTLEVGKWKAARATLQAIHSAEEEFCIHRGTYAALGAPGVANTIVGGRYIDDPNDPDQRDWIYTATPAGVVTPGDCGTFTATAQRRAGRNASETVTIDKNGDLGGTFDPN